MILSLVFHLLSLVSCLTSHVSRLTCSPVSPVSRVSCHPCLPSLVSRLLCMVSCLPSPNSCLHCFLCLQSPCVNFPLVSCASTTIYGRQGCPASCQRCQQRAGCSLRGAGQTSGVLAGGAGSLVHSGGGAVSPWPRPRWPPADRLSHRVPPACHSEVRPRHLD